MKLIVTGGFGFIGSHLVRHLVKKSHNVINIDNRSYSSMPESLNDCKKNKLLKNINININNQNKLKKIFNDFNPDSIIHLAAESHVDNSIKSPKIFIDSNINGTYNLLEVTREYLRKNNKKKKFIFLHVSTDEVYGSLKSKKDKPFDENFKYLPNSPYSASKAASDLLVRSWNKTFSIPTIITNCCNNFGPWQFPEKLIPVVIYKCLNKKNIPIYGRGTNIREWMHVQDHVANLLKILNKGKIGESYNIGSGFEINNIDLTYKICKILDELIPYKHSYSKFITLVKDRAGHDFRYAINSNKIKKVINFKIKNNFDQDLRNTLIWYLDNRDWLQSKL